MTPSHQITAQRPFGPVLEELSVAALTHDVECERRVLPKGTKGTVVGVYRGGVAYEVEFESPFHAVLTLEPSDLKV